MAYSIVGSAVSITRGRGAARVTLLVSFKELDAWAKRQQVDVPRLMQRSFGRACAGLKQKFRQVIVNAGGVCGVPKFKDFEEFTKELRAKRGTTAVPMGGMLAELGSMYGGKSGGWYYVGWKNYLETAAKRFEDGFGGEQSERYFTDPAWRQSWHRQGFKDIPRAYVHNPRHVLPEPFGSFVKAHLDEWATGAFYKELAKQMQKGAAA